MMKMFPSMSYWDAYALPIPIRRFLLEENMNAGKKEEELDVPLSVAKKEKYKSVSEKPKQRIEQKQAPNHVSSAFQNIKKT